MFGRKKKEEERPEAFSETERKAMQDEAAAVAAEVERRKRESDEAARRRNEDFSGATTLLEAKKSLLDIDRKEAEVRAELAAIAQRSKGGYIVAVITVPLFGGRRRAISWVNVDVTGSAKPLPPNKKLKAPAIMKGRPLVGLDEGLLFTVNGRSYELDVESIMFEMPEPTAFYDRDRAEPIMFFERVVSYKGRLVSTISLLGHYSLRIDKLIAQKLVEIAARERPEEVKQPFTRMVVLLIAIMTFLLGMLIGRFGF